MDALAALMGAIIAVHVRCMSPFATNITESLVR